MKVLDSLKVGNQSLKEVQKLFSLEDIEKIMDETREGIEKQNVCTFHHSFLTYILNCC
jgi:charged multivesicular body protein 6